MRGLRGQPFWDCHQAWPFVRTLEAYANQMLGEAMEVAPKLTKAYPYLFTQGSWQNLFLFRGRTWNADACRVMPRTCQLLMPEIPTKPGLPSIVPNNEEIVLFRSMAGAYVGPHSGAVNNQINIHLTLKGGRGAFLDVAGDRRELQAGKALCFQDSYLHSLEHKCKAADECQERISLVVRVLHPDFDLQSLGNSNATEAEKDLRAFSESSALRAELSQMRQAFRKLAYSKDLGGGEPCKAPVPTDAEVQTARELLTFLSQEFYGWKVADVREPIDAIVILSNWYDRLSKVKKVLELAAGARNVPIVVAGGRGRLSSIRAAELDGEAHVTLANLLVLLERPGELGTATAGSVSNPLVAISCNECPTPELRAKCGCVGNTGFNTDRFLDWAAANLPPLSNRPRRVVIVEESYLSRRVRATVLGRLSGMTAPSHAHNHSTMQVSVVSAVSARALEQLLQVHESMPGAVMQLMADEVARLANYSSGDAGSPQLFSRSMFLGDVQAAISSVQGKQATCAEGPHPDEDFQRVVQLARELSARYAAPMANAARDRQLFWRCVAPRDSEGMGLM